MNVSPQVANNESGKAWKTWFDSEAPEDAPIPDGYQGSLDTFRKLLLIRAWCPDRTINQARRYITDAIGKEVNTLLSSYHFICFTLGKWFSHKKLRTSFLDSKETCCSGILCRWSHLWSFVRSFKISGTLWTIPNVFTASKKNFHSKALSGTWVFLRDIATIYPLSILLGILYHVLSRIPREVLGVLRVKHASLVLTVRWRSYSEPGSHVGREWH